MEAGLGFACRKDGNYIGNEHVTRARISGVTKKYAFFTLEDKVSLEGNQIPGCLPLSNMKKL